MHIYVEKLTEMRKKRTRACIGKKNVVTLHRNIV